MTIELSPKEIEDFNCSASWVEQELNETEIKAFLSKNRLIYWSGKKWGFTDTVVREDIMKALAPDECMGGNR